MISATHSHTGPVLPNRGTRDEALGGRGDPSGDYLSTLPARIAEAVRDAHAALAPATAQAAIGHEDSISFNRRFHMRDGTVGWNPGKLNPDIVKPAGPIDPQLPIVQFGPPGDAPFAIYVNYAVHLDNVGGLEISADMPATLARLIGEVYGRELVTLYATGCCGDVNHIDVQWGQRQHGHDNAARMGTILAGEVLRTIPRLQPVAAAPLQTLSETVWLPLAPITPDQIERARVVAERLEKRTTPPPDFLEQVEAFKVLDVAAREGRPFEVEVQVITLGRDLAWVALPGEVFVELGLAVKQDSPFRQTMIAELANGSVGYVVPRRAYAQGAYEVVSTRCGEGAGELLVDAASRLLRACYLAAGDAPAAASGASQAAAISASRTDS